MAAEVSSLVRRYGEEKSQLQNSDVLMTKDLLGSLSKVENIEILDLELKRGKIYKEGCDSPLSSPSSSSSKNQESKVQDLNHRPIDDKLFLEETCLDLKLGTSKSHNMYQSVCTIDKVKDALEREERENTKRRSSSLSSSPSSSTTLLSLPSPSSSPGMFAAACPACLMYVITLKTNPRCPRCNSVVRSSLLPKKPRIDLNTWSF